MAAAPRTCPMVLDALALPAASLAAQKPAVTLRWVERIGEEGRGPVTAALQFDGGMGRLSVCDHHSGTTLDRVEIEPSVVGPLTGVADGIVWVGGTGKLRGAVLRCREENGSRSLVASTPASSRRGAGSELPGIGDRWTVVAFDIERKPIWEWRHNCLSRLAPRMECSSDSVTVYSDVVDRAGALPESWTGVWITRKGDEVQHASFIPSARRDD